MARFVCPVRPRFDREELNTGGRKNQYIIDGQGTRAARTTVAGLSAALTPSNRVWFLLTHPDSRIRDMTEAKAYFHVSGEASRRVLSNSNFYQVMGTFYWDWVCFSNACLFIEEDDEDILRFTTIPIGEWACGNDYKLRGRCFMREYEMTVRQVVEKFCEKGKDGKYDLSKVSPGIASNFMNGQTETSTQITHMVFRNYMFKEREINFKKRYISVYYETGTLQDSPYGDSGSTGGDVPLKVGGYDMFPALFGRWGLRAGDSYGSWGPTNVAIGDVRELQYVARLQAEAVLKQVNPALTGGGRLKKNNVDLTPGEITWMGDPKTSDSLRSVYDVRFDIDHATALRQDIRESIKDAYYVNAFQRFVSTNRSYLTAKQVGQEEREVLTELSPVLELLNHDVLRPLIDMVFITLAKRKLLPEAPEVLQGELFDVEYVSTLHQAQKLMNAGGIERFFTFVGNAAGIQPEVLDKINPDGLVNEYGDVTSIPPGLVRSDAEAGGIREQRAQAQQQEKMVDDTMAESDIAKNLGAAKVNEEETALGALLGVES